MSSDSPIFNKKQMLFKEIFAGTLIYAIILGFFNDYTDIFYAKSFSLVFIAAIVMQILTQLTFLLKDKSIDWLKNRKGLQYKFSMFFCIWLIMFVSKFIFLRAIDWLLGENIQISGFVGLLAIIILATVTNKLVDFTFKQLGD